MQLNHWAYRLADKIEERKPEGTITITSGITTSGPAHLGTLVEALFPNTIAKALRERGREVRFVFIADILDAFDGIPKGLEEFEEMLTPHLGKPLRDVPDPYSCHASYGEHFLQEALDIFKKFNIEPDVVRAYEIYDKGAFDDDTLLYLSKIEEVKKILEEVSGRQLKKTWNPIMPICQKCGKIATTVVRSFDLEGNYTYSCDADVGYTKGCGYEGSSNIKDHHYKLQWRLHWPSWQKYFESDVEGGGVDHFTKGGSWDTAVAIHKKIFHREPPIGYKYGFLMEKGKKMSKSKGVMLTLKDFIALIPASVIAYHLLKYDLEENIDFTAEKENVLRMIYDYEQTSALIGKEELSRAEQKKLAAYKLAGEKQWEGNFADYLLYYSVYRDWSKVKEHLGKSDEFVQSYIEEWFKREFVPDDYDFTYRPEKAEGDTREFISSLNKSMDALAIHNAVYDFAQKKSLNSKDMFKSIYQVLIGKEKGPRLGKLIYALGIDRIKEDVL
ncbi:MAG: lysine--tRNA ligase [Methanobacteriota archaeon]|nr:MAG: lysine--tRNA ligase [Euryarchaeota archaeon]